MSWEGWVLLALLALLVVGWILWLLANRVDRLHRRVLQSRAALEVQLAQRATAALELGLSGALDPVEGILVADAAQRAVALAPVRVVRDGLDGPDEFDALEPFHPQPSTDRALVESELSRALRAVLASYDTTTLAHDAPGAEALRRLDAAWYRLEVARRFHNAHVAEVRRLRSHLVVRLLRLAGRAPMPGSFEMDDARGQRDH
ncbi:MAG TPA: hypothetical protein VK024_03440 [Actinomycetaceae bacterium]|nr:hypothetical protein [Actinomycetaceae bacterium]